MDEAVAFFAGPGETMVLTLLGAVALDGIAAGCNDLTTLEAWCTQRGFGGSSEDIRDGLHCLASKLAELEIIEMVS
jgi:hypothetical protein